MKPLILGASGRLSVKNKTLFFKNEKFSKSYPVEDTNEIFAFGELDLNTKLLAFLSKMEISLHLFGYYGNYLGTFYPKEQYISGKLHIEQMASQSPSIASP
jgi:CRISPR-associated protein Cas1